MFGVTVENDSKEKHQTRTRVILLSAVAQIFTGKRIESVFIDGIENVAHFQEACREIRPDKKFDAKFVRQMFFQSNSQVIKH